MAENDIYNSQEAYEARLANIDNLTVAPSLRRSDGRYGGTYYCKNAANLEHFRRLARVLEARDISYIRRIRLYDVLKMISFATDKNLASCDRDDISSIVAFSHSRLRAANSKSDFVKDIRVIWKALFPERDEQGRVDDTIVPYPVRHLTRKIDRSRHKLRDDRLNPKEFEKLLQAFSDDRRMQAFVALAFECLGRPQELLYLRIKDVELHDNYARIWIREHGKEGPGFLPCIDSYPYVVTWYDEHPLRHDPDAFLFPNLSSNRRYGQLSPEGTNKQIRIRLERLGIKKRITNYSLKRNGVTFRRMRGDSDATIQHTARWTSTRQLKTYDQSDPDDVFKVELAKRGLIKEQSYKQYYPSSKKCTFCEHFNGATEEVCRRCKRPLDRERLLQEVQGQESALAQEKEERERLGRELADLRRKFEEINVFMNRLVERDPEVIDLLASRVRGSREASSQSPR